VVASIPSASENEGHPQRLEVIQEAHEVLEVPAKPVQSPNHEGVESPAPGILH
jgi:hypothetical protein